MRAEPGRLTVSDTGPGLSPEDLPRAFERFYPYERYGSERAVGSGLGLAIVGELARANGGTVSAANSPGGGAQFELRLQTGVGGVENATCVPARRARTGGATRAGRSTGGSRWAPRSPEGTA